MERTEVGPTSWHLFKPSFGFCGLNENDYVSFAKFYADCPTILIREIYYFWRFMTTGVGLRMLYINVLIRLGKCMLPLVGG